MFSCVRVLATTECVRYEKGDEDGDYVRNTVGGVRELDGLKGALECVHSAGYVIAISVPPAIAPARMERKALALQR